MPALIGGFVLPAPPYRDVNECLDNRCDPAGTARDRHGSDDISDLARPPSRGGIGVRIRYTNEPDRKHPPNGIKRVNRRILGRDGVRRLLCSREVWERGEAAPEKARTFSGSATSGR